MKKEAKRELTKYPGVYERKSDSRIINGKADVCFDITYKVDGKKKYEKVGWLSEGYSAKVASNIRSERLRSIRHGDELPKQKAKVPYFKEVASKYLEWAEKNKAREGRDDEYRYRRYLSPALDNKHLSEISSFDLESLKTKLIDKDLAPGSVKHCLVLFRQIFNKAVLWGLYKGENPIKGVKMPILQNQRERYLKYDEADLLLEELAKSSGQTHDMALLSLHCGLRAGEIFNLKGQDLDFDNEVINISDPKNKESRKAFMTESVKEMLLKLVPSKRNEYVFKKRIDKDEAAGVSGKDKKQEEKIDRVSNVYQKAVKKLGFNDGITDPRQMVTFHTLRHTFASWLALQGETILTIKELLGHKTLAMTARYAHLMPEHKRRATLELEKNFLLNKKTNPSNGGK